MKTKFAAFKHWMESGYYKKNGQAVWDLHLQLLRDWGVLSQEVRKFIVTSKTILLGEK